MYEQKDIVILILLISTLTGKYMFDYFTLLLRNHILPFRLRYQLKSSFQYCTEK